MSTDKEQWIEDAMNSVERIERVKAREDLYEEIEQHVFGRVEVSFSSLQWRWVAAAVILLLIVNVVAVQVYVTNSFGDASSHEESYISYRESLISDYKLYEW